MLDRKDFYSKDGGNLEEIKDSQRKRYASIESLPTIVAELQKKRGGHKMYDTDLGFEINQMEKDIMKLIMKQKTGLEGKEKEETEEQRKTLVAKKKILDKQRKDAKAEAKTIMPDEELDAMIKKIGNYVHSSVPVSDNEDDNQLIREWVGDKIKPETKDWCLSHHDVLDRIAGYDPVRGVRVAGHRGYCLTGYGVFLNLALIQYGLDFLVQRGYQPNQPPFFMNQAAMGKTAQLEQFDEELYHVSTGVKEEDKYLIATSEQPLSYLHVGEWLQRKELPIRYAGYSTCFRKEAGSHGRDAWGIFRVHQFEKIEQFVLCAPDESWEEFDKMISYSEEFYKSLELPHRVVAIVSGALNNAASKKYDLEAWFPFQGEYKELVSCSNCTDYQTRDIGIRFGIKTQFDAEDGNKTFVHALNSTLCATERALCCIIENWQTEEGVVVPPVLRKYIPGQPEFLPFVKDLSKDSTSARAGRGTEETKKPSGEAAGETTVVDKVVESVKSLAT